VYDSNASGEVRSDHTKLKSSMLNVSDWGSVLKWLIDICSLTQTHRMLRSEQCGYAAVARFFYLSTCRTSHGHPGTPNTQRAAVPDRDKEGAKFVEYQNGQLQAFSDGGMSGI
jgi:hypothetical protein